MWFADSILKQLSAFDTLLVPFCIPPDGKRSSYVVTLKFAKKGPHSITFCLTHILLSWFQSWWGTRKCISWRGSAFSFSNRLKKKILWGENCETNSIYHVQQWALHFGSLLRLSQESWASLSGGICHLLCWRKTPTCEQIGFLECSLCHATYCAWLRAPNSFVYSGAGSS